jgi:hypothetical protein
MTRGGICFEQGVMQRVVSKYDMALMENGTSSRKGAIFQEAVHQESY